MECFVIDISKNSKASIVCPLDVLSDILLNTKGTLDAHDSVHVHSDIVLSGGSFFFAKKTVEIGRSLILFGGSKFKPETSVTVGGTLALSDNSELVVSGEEDVTLLADVLLYKKSLFFAPNEGTLEIKGQLQISNSTFNVAKKKLLLRGTVRLLNSTVTVMAGTDTRHWKRDNTSVIYAV
jgi:hypothetical protein